ncbi:hypothetical protein [Bacillus toyonensis]|uniref:hypothetical protein n=1 Tax=Bacillus toyonensis TaxID=155322 RepID=UPI000BF0707A|nr:hypothetical protein [Bacillus toyonensis]PEO30894.1 hypothetical protein CN589_07820 [Bacillus toyonensis]
MSEYKANETVTISLERYHDLIDQTELLESKSIDNFISYEQSKGKVNVTVNTAELDSYLKQRYQYPILCITKHDVEVKYKGDERIG